MKHQVGRKTIEVALDAIDVDIVRSKTPVKTGNLRDNFSVDAEGNIVNPVDYADEIEFGTIKRPGAFMVERSLAEIGNRLAERIAKQIDQTGLVILPEITLKVKL